MNRTLLEICVEDLDGIEAAATGGADRLELCNGLALGGLSPSPSFAARALESGLAVHAMVRPRPGDFVYSAEELALMIAEIRMLAATGVHGIVVGATRVDGSPDGDSLGRLRDAAADIQIVLHRAIDLAPDPVQAIELACSLGYDHVLSSGGASTAAEGAATLTQMVAAAAGRLSIIAGSGITANDVAGLVQATRVPAVHASASTGKKWADSRVFDFGFGPSLRRSTDPAKVAGLRAALENLRIPK
jgi:copper homeostasis protein